MSNIEKSRYDKKAREIIKTLKKNNSNKLHDMHEISCASEIQYEFYKRLIKEKVTKDMRVLEIGSGTGEFSWPAISSGAHVTLSDISEISLKASKYRFKKFNKNLEFIKADMENLPFKNEFFNIVLCAGSLSYGDHDLVRKEIFRVLKHKGYFICIDSLNHNFIYRINRLIHFIKGNRSLSTIKRIPNLNLIKSYEQFGYGKHYYFGAFFWLSKILEKFITNKTNLKLIKLLDKYFANHLTAFNFVMIVEKIDK